MVKQSLDFEDTYVILTEWDEWDKLVQRGYEAQNAQDDVLVDCWWLAWEIFQGIIRQEKEKCSVSGLMEEQDY